MNNDKQYKQWLHQVDLLILDYIGLCSGDLEDYCYRDLFENECTPQEALNALLDEGIIPNL